MQRAIKGLLKVVEAPIPPRQSLMCHERCMKARVASPATHHPSRSGVFVNPGSTGLHAFCVDAKKWMPGKAHDRLHEAPFHSSVVSARESSTSDFDTNLLAVLRLMTS